MWLFGDKDERENTGGLQLVVLGRGVREDGERRSGYATREEDGRLMGCS